MKISFLKIVFVLVFGIFCFSPLLVSASSTDNMSGYAWSSNIGWISFNCINSGNNCATSDYGVNKDATTGNLTGYAWSSNIGWIQFGNLSGWPTGGGTTPANAKVTGSNLTGWAKALSADGNGWDGWIALSGTGYGVTLTNNAFSSYAWGSEVVGWVNFSGVVVSSAFPVLTPGTIDVSNYVIAMLQKNSNIAWYNKLTQIAYAAGAVAGKPIRLTTPITNSGVATTTSFSNKYFIDINNDNGLSAPVFGPSENNGWDVYSVTIAGMGANATVNASVDIPAGLPEGTHGIVFCADVNGDVSDPAQPTISRCTAKTVSYVGPAESGMSGTLTPATSSCVIASGASACPVNLSWSIINPEGIPTAITATGMTDVNVTNTLTTPQSGGPIALTVPWGGRTFYLYNNTILLAQSVVSASSVTCAPLNSWNGTICTNTPVNGGWSDPNCPTVCGQSASTVTRTCTNPTPANGGANCVPPATYNCPATTACSNGDGNACSTDLTTHYKCDDGSDGTSQISSPSRWSWMCGTTSCLKTKSPGYIEN